MKIQYIWTQDAGLQGGGISRHKLQAVADLEASFIGYTVLLQGVLASEPVDFSSIEYQVLPHELVTGLDYGVYPLPTLLFRVTLKQILPLSFIQKCDREGLAVLPLHPTLLQQQSSNRLLLISPEIKQEVNDEFHEPLLYNVSFLGSSHPQFSRFL